MPLFNGVRRNRLVLAIRVVHAQFQPVRGRFFRAGRGNAGDDQARIQGGLPRIFDKQLAARAGRGQRHLRDERLRRDRLRFAAVPRHAALDFARFQAVAADSGMARQRNQRVSRRLRAEPFVAAQRVGKLLHERQGVGHALHQRQRFQNHRLVAQFRAVGVGKLGVFRHGQFGLFGQLRRRFWLTGQRVGRREHPPRRCRQGFRFAQAVHRAEIRHLRQR